MCSMQREQMSLYYFCDLEFQFNLGGAINRKWKKVQWKPYVEIQINTKKF